MFRTQFLSLLSRLITNRESGDPGPVAQGGVSPVLAVEVARLRAGRPPLDRELRALIRRTARPHLPQP